MPKEDRPPCARTLVIPMCREAPRIAGTIHTLAASSLNHPGTEIILVDDGSDDDTVAVARAALAATSLAASILCLERNLGKGGAVRAGVLASAGRVVGFSDAELLLVAERLGLRVEEVPVEWRHVEESRVRPVRDGFAMLRDALRLRFARAHRRAPRPTGMRTGPSR